MTTIITKNTVLGKNGFIKEYIYEMLKRGEGRKCGKHYLNKLKKENVC